MVGFRRVQFPCRELLGRGFGRGREDAVSGLAWVFERE
nr:MAG TPA: hypothetical protein [Caudoviricetes sp.]